MKLLKILHQFTVGVLVLGGTVTETCPKLGPVGQGSFIFRAASRRSVSLVMLYRITCNFLEVDSIF
jgi:hypothetical protein